VRSGPLPTTSRHCQHSSVSGVAGRVTWDAELHATRRAEQPSQHSVAIRPGRLRAGSDQQKRSRYGRLWSQVVAAAQGVPANVVAIWSQSADPAAVSDPVTGPLTSGFGGAPRGIRTPNRQIRSQPSPVPARPSRPFASPMVLVNGPVGGSGRASVPTRHAWHGGNVVAISDHGRQTRSLATAVDWPRLGR
jgi:hypothetical protein